ncbi:DUF6602 domain-containing protein [Psychrobacillus sp. L3]|uniref:DUF6602 domain-containing protein n=1 Tax=Psychrobacillus sp. L3 TaxID=3236891 RepID=UPI0036F28721
MKYHESIAKEFEASRDRVRYFIKDAHHAEDGRYKEILLMNYLRRVLPSNVSVGTDFVKNGTEITKQIDLIIYNNSIPTLFSEGDFVIAIAESIYGIIEVKSKLPPGERCKRAIENANHNGRIIDREIFNGIFSYESAFEISDNVRCVGALRECLRESKGFINHISLGSKYFIKYWNEGNPVENDSISSYSFYKLNNLSFGYFISNLIETIYSESMDRDIESNLTNFLYPIEEGKETRRLRNLEVKVDVPIS